MKFSNAIGKRFECRQRDRALTRDPLRPSNFLVRHSIFYWMWLFRVAIAISVAGLASQKMARKPNSNALASQMPGSRDSDLEILSIAWDKYQDLHLWRNDAC